MKHSKSCHSEKKEHYKEKMHSKKMSKKADGNKKMHHRASKKGY